MGLYLRHLVPRMVDHGMRGDAINTLRACTLEAVRGRVLEIGFGTGLNARYYPKAITGLVTVDPNPGMTRFAEQRLRDAGLTAQHVVTGCEHLPFPDRSFDAVVSTFTLCSVAGLPAALAELRRVLAPEGALHFVEHGLADTARDQAWQRRLNPLWRPFSGGCNLTRDVPALLTAHGFMLAELHPSLLEGTSPVFGTIRRGVAVPRRDADSTAGGSSADSQR